MGKNVQDIAHQTASHLYVHDGDLKTEDGLAADIRSIEAQNAADFRAPAPYAQTAPLRRAHMTDRVSHIATAIGQIADSAKRMNSDMTEVAAIAEQLESLVGRFVLTSA